MTKAHIPGSKLYQGIRLPHEDPNIEAIELRDKYKRRIGNFKPLTKQSYRQAAAASGNFREGDHHDMKCYACDNPGKPRDVGGTEYYLCDECYKIHIVCNKLAIAALMGQLTLRRNHGYQNKQIRD